jgi:hypothetical protein
MSRVSYTAEGFRAAFRRPSLTFAEVSWRWAVGATAAALWVFALLEYLDSLPVTDGQLLLLRTKQAFLVGPVIAHILRGSLSRAVPAGLFASLALCGFWIAASSIGRAVAVGDLLDYFADRGKVAGTISREAFSRRPIRALVALNFLRAALALAAIFAFLGAAIVASFVSPASDPQPALGLVAFLPLAGLVGWAWWALNWLLSLASVFAARDGEDAIAAVSAAMALCRQRGGAVFAVSTWTGIAHVAIFAGAAIVVSVPLGMVAVVPWRLVVGGIVLVTLAYFVVADWLYVARLAGYVSILELPEILISPAPLPATRSLNELSGAVQATIDFEEPILSDIPSGTRISAVET